ncbi:MAG: site-2 protease family protein [Caldilineaceae bacterium]|nr:site-2 protease family protein [Caldilineaceae bacterium]
MGTSLTLFRVAGIDVRVHWSFALILVYGAVIYSGDADNAAVGALYGMLVILLLFVCVTLHEFGHALAARFYGISVPTITLLPIGGVANLERMPDKPRQELIIALAGPLVNLALVVILLPITLFVFGFQAQQSPGVSLSVILSDISTPGLFNLLVYLTSVNLMLALFNLLPAFPMDGGRILRALLAMTMPYLRATWIAVVVGRIMAVIFAVLGIFGGNLFMLLIAFFVYTGGNGEMQAVRTRRALGNIPLRAALKVGGPRLYSSELLSRAVDIMPAATQTAFPVMDLSGNLAGVLSHDRLIYGLREAGPSGRVADYMIPASEVPVSSVDDQLMEIWERMLETKSRFVAVQDHERRFLGIISSADLGEVIHDASVSGDPQSRNKTIAGSATVVPEQTPDG